MAENEKVMVGCKIPGGVVLHVMKRLDRPKSDDAGSIPMEDMGMVTLPGFAPPRQESITSVDKALWDVWSAENKGSSLVTSGAIYDADKASKEAAEKAKAEADKAKPAPAPATAAPPK